MKKGFTLIELIFVIVIIGLLAAVAVPKFLTTKKNSEVANLPEIGNMVATKANEQYNLVQEDSLKNIIEQDADLNDMLKTGGKLEGTGIFTTDFNESQLEVNYTANSQNHLCLRVKRVDSTVRISKDKNVTTYNFRVTDINKTCNQDQ